jgi:hypothetical protein
MYDCYHYGEATTLGKVEFIIESERPLELSAQHCIDRLGFSLLCDWDVFAFVYRHVLSLTSADQIARLVGYERDVVGGALDRLERQKLIGGSRPSRGIRFYRVLALKDDDYLSCLRQLVTLSEGRTGRLELARRLKPVRSEWAKEEQPEDTK